MVDQQLMHLLGRDQVGQPIGTQEHSVAWLERTSGDVRRRASLPQGATNDVPLGVLACLFLCENTCPLLFSHPGVILSQLVDAGLTGQIGPAVTGVRYGQLSATHNGSHQGSSHPGEAGFLSLVLNGLVGNLDGPCQGSRHVAEGSVIVLPLHRFHSQPAGCGSRALSSNAVGHDVQMPALSQHRPWYSCRKGQAILVDLALQAGMSALTDSQLWLL
jgi:hypothetical protein